MVSTWLSGKKTNKQKKNETKPGSSIALKQAFPDANPVTNIKTKKKKGEKKRGKKEENVMKIEKGKEEGKGKRKRLMRKPRAFRPTNIISFVKVAQCQN